jgi:hypothetical protein
MIIAENLTVKELSNREFEHDCANQAIEFVKKDITLNPEIYVSGSLSYKDVTINLHEKPDAPGWKLFKSILKDILSKDVINHC